MGIALLANIQVVSEQGMNFAITAHGDKHWQQVKQALRFMDQGIDV